MYTVYGGFKVNFLFRFTFVKRCNAFVKLHDIHICSKRILSNVFCLNVE